MKKKKAQLQIGENVIVLVIFFFLLVIAVIFYARIQKSNILATVEENKKLTTLNFKTIILNTPELKCVEQGDETDNCIDLINARLMAEYWNTLKGQDTNETYVYQNRFGKTNITIKKLNLETGMFLESYTVYDYGLDNTTKEMKPTRTPIVLYHPLNGTYEFGIVEIKTYFLK